MVQKHRNGEFPNEYICINTSVEREGGGAIAKATNRAKPDCCELAQVYTGHIGNGSLVICEGEEGFYHLNTVNNFHRFIKEQYHIYRGVATKYLNRYTALFALVWRQGETALADVCPKLFVPSTTNYHYSIRDVKMEKLLLI